MLLLQDTSRLIISQHRLPAAVVTGVPRMDEGEGRVMVQAAPFIYLRILHVQDLREVEQHENKPRNEKGAASWR